jgi:hypothetical protein
MQSDYYFECHLVVNVLVTLYLSFRWIVLRLSSSD